MRIPDIEPTGEMEVEEVSEMGTPLRRLSTLPQQSDTFAIAQRNLWRAFGWDYIPPFDSNNQPVQDSAE